MRKIVLFLLTLFSLSFASLTLALESGYYLVTDVQFEGDKTELDNARNDFLFSEMMKSLEQELSASTYAVFDEQEQRLSSHNKESERSFLLDKDKATLSNKELPPVKVVAITPTSIKISSKFADSETITLLVQLERVPADDIEILRIKGEIAQHQTALKKEQARLHALLSNKQEPLGVWRALPESSLGITLPADTTLSEPRSLKSDPVQGAQEKAITQFTLNSLANNDVFNEHFIYLSKSDDVAQGIVKKILSRQIYESKAHHDGMTLIVDDVFDRIRLVGIKKVGAFNIVIDVRASDEDMIIARLNQFHSIKQFDEE